MTKPKQKPEKPGKALSIREVLEADLDGKADSRDIRAIFAFDSTLTEKVAQRFRLWSRHLPFHREMDRRDLAVYRVTEPVFINAGFRGCAKTTRTKLFLVFYIANDAEHGHRYIKTFSEDYANARQNGTDLYNLLISPRIKHHYRRYSRRPTLSARRRWPALRRRPA
jgi:hypothetical protein